MVSDSGTSDPTLDFEAALARLGGDRELFAEMAGFLFEDLPKLFEDLRAAIADGNPTAVRSKAHALKGLVAGCGGVRATNIAQSLEDAGHSGDLSQTNPLLDSLHRELDRLTQALAKHRR
jgi:HPt (histidine-containing phosphotransfer) domain-containing protein